MGKLELKKEDWIQVRDQAKTMLKNAMIDAAVFRSTMFMAEDMLKQFPVEKKKNFAGTG